jgi:hypothetical protein
MDKPNRAERRKNKFGGGRATEHGGWPTTEPNPVFGAGEGPGEAETSDTDATADAPANGVAPSAGEAIAGRPDQDQTKQTGPGTGGATEQAGRAPRHEGAHASNSTKG